MRGMGVTGECESGNLSADGMEIRELHRKRRGVRVVAWKTEIRTCKRVNNEDKGVKGRGKKTQMRRIRRRV